MAKKSKLLYFKSVPPKTAYFPGDIGWLPGDRAEEYIHDNYCIDAAAELDPKPYFAPAEVEKLSSPDELEEFVDKKSKEISEHNSVINEAGTEIERISEKITRLKKKRDAQKVGSYKYVKINGQVEEVEKKLPELEKKITNAVEGRKAAEILRDNARIKHFEKFFQDIKSRKEFTELQAQAEKLIEKNNQVKELFVSATADLQLGFQPSLPFLTGRVLGSIQNQLAASGEVIKKISEDATSKIKGKLWAFYKEDFNGKLRDDE